MLRDQALAVEWTLVEKEGGPGVKPPQPAGLWEAVGYLTSNTRNFTAGHRAGQGLSAAACTRFGSGPPRRRK